METINPMKNKLSPIFTPVKVKIDLMVSRIKAQHVFLIKRFVHKKVVAKRTASESFDP